MNRENDEKNLLNQYPAYILENLDLLLAGKMINKQLDSPVYKKKASDIGVKQSHFQNKWYSSDALLYFGCYRRDYELFLFPIANRLSEIGLSVYLVIYDTASPNLSMLSKKVKLLSYKHIIKKYNVHKNANLYYTNHLLKGIETFSSKMALTSSQKNKLYAFYKRYAIDFLLTDYLIQETRPKCIYGIHFLLTPGCIRAIENSKYPIICTLIQHGLIASEKYERHHFKGADLVFVWGEFFNNLLKAKENAPASIVLGNPKLEQAKNDFTLLNKSIKKDGFNILYVLTGSLQDEFNSKNLILFSNSIKKMNKIRVIYKLHPNSSKRECEFFIRKGIMKENEIINDVPIQLLINQSDLVIGDYSTSIYEAAAWNKPVIQIYQSNYPEIYIKFSSVNTHEQLTNLINRLYKDQKYYADFIKKQQQSVSELFLQIDGSINRIASHIQTLIGKN